MADNMMAAAIDWSGRGEGEGRKEGRKEGKGGTEVPNTV
jgi:hypothetical protein